METCRVGVAKKTSTPANCVAQLLLSDVVDMLEAWESLKVEGIMTMTDESKKKSESDPPEGFQVIDYNEQEEIVTIELHRHLLQHPQHRKAIITKFVEIIEHGPNLKGVGAVARKKQEPQSN
jgi:hypothetical protein